MYLNIPFVHELAIDSYNKFHNRLNPHPNPLVPEPTEPNLPHNPPRRLKRQWPRDLIQLHLHIKKNINNF
jgi:hypothetical protein